MARVAREEVFSPDEIAVVHVMNRVVRRCFLLGTDPVSGQNYDHRKLWIEDLLAAFRRLPRHRSALIYSQQPAVSQRLNAVNAAR